jgi:hypothetical protein
MIVYPNGGVCQYQFSGPWNMTSGDSLLVRIENAFQVTFDIVIAPSSNYSRTVQDLKGVTTSGFWQRLSFPDQVFIVAKSTGLSTAFTISYQFIPLLTDNGGDASPVKQV